MFLFGLFVFVLFVFVVSKRRLRRRRLSFCYETSPSAPKTFFVVSSFLFLDFLFFSLRVRFFCYETVPSAPKALFRNKKRKRTNTKNTTNKKQRTTNTTPNTNTTRQKKATGPFFILGILPKEILRFLHHTMQTPVKTLLLHLMIQKPWTKQWFLYLMIHTTQKHVILLYFHTFKNRRIKHRILKKAM